MRIVGRVIALAFAGLMVSAVGTAIAALTKKRQILPIDDPDADEVRLAAIFEPIVFESTASAFRGGTLDLWFGGGIIDLRKATLDPAGARLEVRAMFGGCQLLVPATWRVTTRVTGIGGAGDSRPQIERSSGSPSLTVEGITFFGGLGIASDIREEAVGSVREAIAKRQRGRGVGVPVMEREPEPVTS